MNQILKSSELKSLRQSRGVSQAQLAKAVRIQRSYISQFENGKFTFKDDEQLSIKEYLDSMDGINGVLVVEPNDVKLDSTIRDGFLVPGGLDSEEIEANLAGLQESIQSFHDACAAEIPSGLFGLDSEELETLQRDAGLRAIRALSHIFELQGRELIDTETECCVGETLSELL